MIRQGSGTDLVSATPSIGELAHPGPGPGPVAIDLSTVALVVNGWTMVPADIYHAKIADGNGNGTPDLVVRFDRQRVVEHIGLGPVTVAITGSVGASIRGRNFQGTDTVIVIN